MVNYDFFDRLDAKNREAEHKEVVESPLTARDIFFLYPKYIQGLEHRAKAQKWLKMYTSYKKNQATIIKEIFDMEQLLEARILNMDKDVILSEDISNKIDTNYVSAFEDLVRRLSNYRERTGRELFNTTEDIHAYLSYLTSTTKFNSRDYNIVLGFMDKKRITDKFK